MASCGLQKEAVELKEQLNAEKQKYQEVEKMEGIKEKLEALSDGWVVNNSDAIPRPVGIATDITLPNATVRAIKDLQTYAEATTVRDTRAEVDEALKSLANKNFALEVDK
ncbi:hypothetical protein N0V91_007411 [Didymella pomorum]|uniref:Uncharacterized protein n=1 Tax=Didymella pomorum TaxID=749634 RepID=A0A9W9D6I1_9PLEO|nr:hypothetical protein N0V91_007411 [Didymella pomorum]